MKRLVAIILAILLFCEITALAENWICPKCGHTATGSFCSKCGKKKPADNELITPTPKPEVTATVEPTITPTTKPAITPTIVPTEVPTTTPTNIPTEAPTAVPTKAPKETTTIASATEKPSYDWLTQYGYDGTNVIIIPADILYEYGSSYVGKTIVTSIVVKEKSGKSLKANTTNNDTYSFSIVANFTDKAEINSIKEGNTVIVVGTVDEMGTISLFGADKTVNLINCQIITTGITTAEIENSHNEALQNAQKEQAEKETETANALAKEIQEYMNSCMTVKYSDVERNPQKYKGTLIKVTGKVIQVSEGWFNTVTLRVKQSDGDIWYITYTRSDDEPRIIENDKLTFYGKCTGVETYRNILGGNVTIPAMEAKYYK